MKKHDIKDRRLAPPLGQEDYRELDWTKSQQARWADQRVRLERTTPERRSGGSAKTKTWLLPNREVGGWSEGLKDLPPDPLPQPRPLSERPPHLPAGPSAPGFKTTGLPHNRGEQPKDFLRRRKARKGGAGTKTLEIFQP